MIDPNNIEQSVVMPQTDFEKIAEQGDQGPLINVVAVKTGWAIFGPGGVYESPDGTRVFADRSQVHKLIAAWGLRRFVEGGELKQFS